MKGLGALALGLLAMIGMAPQANAAFTTPECEGASILGRGASFAQAAHGAWEFNFRNVFCSDGPNITYDPAGSGAGRTAVTLRGASDPRFGGTDDPLTSSQKTTINAGDALNPNDDGLIHQIPAAVGAVAVIVNFPNSCDATLLTPAHRTDAVGTGDDNLTRVRFDKATLEGIFAKDAGFDRWDVVFPELNVDDDCDKPIIRVVRFDNSGTTFAFKDYLHRVDPAEGWLTTYQTGTNGNREWPGAVFGGSGQCGATSAPGNEADATDQLTSGCANGNENLVPALSANDGSIGYSDVATARTAVPTLAVNPAGVTPPDKYWTQVQNGATPTPEWEEPTSDDVGYQTTGDRGANCADTQFVSVGATTLGDWSQTSGVNSPTGYGICTLTYGLVFDDNAEVYGVSPLEEQRAATVKDYWTSIVHDSGQTLLTLNDYAPLPAGILAIARAGVDEIDWNKAAGGSDDEDPPGGNTPPGGNNPPGGNTPTPPPAKPSNTFSVPKTAISSKTGSATVSVKLPGAGKLVLLGNAKSGKKTIKVGGVVLTASKAGTFKLTLKPGKAAKALLKKKGSLKVSLKLTFTPNGGTAKSSTRSVTLKLTKPKKKSGRR
jgi:ABC-type phosphate transport system substrate-binding protein